MTAPLLIQNALIPDFETMTLAPGEIKISGGRIERVGPAVGREGGEELLDAGGMLCLPAFVDCHTHLVQSLQKGMLDDLNITDWLVGMLGTQSALTDEQWYWGVMLGLAQGLRFGVTTFHEMTYYPHIDAAVQAYLDAGARVTFGLGATDIAENEKIPVLGIDAALRQAEDIYTRYHAQGGGLIRTAVAPQGLPACSAELMREMKAFARERDLTFHTHLAEGKRETESVRHRTGYGEGEALFRLGVLDERTVLAHSIWLSQEEIGLIAQSGATVAYCPSTNMKLSDGTAPIAAMAAADVNVALGCDGEASSSNRDIIREARTGAYLQKVATLDPAVLSTRQLYAMMSENGAKPLGYPGLGRLESGAVADLVLVDMDDISLLNPRACLSNLLFAGSGFQVDTVLVEGRVRLRKKQFTDLDADKIRFEAERVFGALYPCQRGDRPCRKAT